MWTQAYKQKSYSNLYLKQHSSKMKWTRVGKRGTNTDDTPMCYRRGNQRTWRKISPPPSKRNRSTRQSVKIHGWAKDPPSLIYPLYLSPPSSYSNKASRNHVLSSTPNPATSFMLHLPSLTSSNASQQHQKPHLTLSNGVVSVCTINLSMIWK